MFSEVSIKVDNVSKCFQIYDRPQDRLKQFIAPRFQRILGLKPKDYFRAFWALNNISLEIKKGETVGIVGRNGSGKSTLLQIICGTLNPNSGTISIRGRIAALLELGSGFNPEFTGRENVSLNAAILGLSQAEIAERFDQIVSFADIGDFLDRPVKTYSSGMVVRLAFAVAINASPDILIVDEALAVGDEAFQRKCFSRIEQLRKQGATILFVSHNAQLVVQLCDHAILLDGGEKILGGAPRLVVTQYQRLLNLSGNLFIALRESMKAEHHISQSSIPSSTQGGSESLGNEFLETLIVDEEAIFDPDLSSSPLITYENQGAEIINTQIKTFTGKRVNVLASRRRYLISYSVKFKQSASEVAFGFSISTLVGFGVGGAGTSLDDTNQVAFVEQGQEVLVTFEFECVLNPAVYFLTAGVSGMVGGERKFLHRVVEALTFKVLSKDQKIATGCLNLNPIPLIQIQDSGSLS